MFRRLAPIVKKEFRQIKRDKRVLAILTLVPAMLLLLNGYALNFDVTHIKLGVFDEEKSMESREFVNGFLTSGYFDCVATLSSTEQATELIDDAKIRLAIIIPPDFSRDILAGRQASVQVLIDGMDANAATTVVGYAQAVTLQYSQKIILKNLSKMGRGSLILLSRGPAGNRHAFPSSYLL